MFKNKADISKNRLSVSFNGKFDINKILVGKENVIQEARKLKPGFGVISDISEFIPLTEEARLVMQSTMKALKDMGIGHVVRIVKDISSISGSQWQRTSKKVGYIADQVLTLAEAEVMLDKLEKDT